MFYIRQVIMALISRLVTDHTHSLMSMQYSATPLLQTSWDHPDYRGIRISEASSVFPVGVAMHTRAVERYEGAF